MKNLCVFAVMLLQLAISYSCASNKVAGKGSQFETTGYDNSKPIESFSGYSGETLTEFDVYENHG